jgi:hypothetical protein
VVSLSLTAVRLALLGAARPREALIGVAVVGAGALVGEIVGLASRPRTVGEGGSA